MALLQRSKISKSFLFKLSIVILIKYSTIQYHTIPPETCIEGKVLACTLEIISAHPKMSINLFKKSNFPFKIMNFILENGFLAGPAIQYNTIQYNTNFIQHYFINNTMQYNTIQYNTMILTVLPVY